MQAIHERTKTNGVGGDDQERNLPGEADSDEAVVKRGMRDRRRVLPANHIEHEIQRSEYQHTPDASTPENNLREFHLGLCPLFSPNR
jgi:hypothetical protein